MFRHVSFSSQHKFAESTTRLPHVFPLIQVGLTIFLVHVVLIPFTGCSINPARSFGPAVVNGYWRQHWIWWIAPLLGGLVAATVYSILFFWNEEPKESSVQQQEGRSAGIFGPFGGPRVRTSG